MGSIEEKRKQANKVIAGWSVGSLVGNLLPPPFDLMCVAGAYAKMGWEIAKVYGVVIDFDELRRIAKVMLKGILAVGAAAHIGTGIFKWVPGVNVAVALLIQPPIVAATSYAVGQGYKQYFEFRLNGKNLSDEEVREIAEKALKSKIGK